MAIGRISGPLLKSNLLRNGVDLAFETDLLYLDVTNRRIGVKTTSPQYALDVQGVARVTDLEITNNTFQVGNVTLDGSTGTISTSAQEFSIATADSTIVGNRVLVGDLEINNNFIENTNTNSDLFNNSNNNFVFNLTNTSGNGYLKIDNVNGMIPPLGNTAQRPGTPEVGNTRYNTQLEYLETWNGTNWINAAGEVESIESNDVEQLAYLFNLILD